MFINFILQQLLVWAMTHCGDNNNCHNWKASDQFKELLGSIPADQVNVPYLLRIIDKQYELQVSEESVCGSTLLQNSAWMGNRSAVALLLQHGFVALFAFFGFPIDFFCLLVLADVIG